MVIDGLAGPAIRHHPATRLDSVPDELGLGAHRLPLRVTAGRHLAAPLAHRVVVHGVFGAAEGLSDEQVDGIIATNLTASIHLIRAVLSHMRSAGTGRIIQLSSYGGQVAFAGNSLYHATKWGIEGFCESVVAEEDVADAGYQDP